MALARVAIDPKGPAAAELGRTLTGSGAQAYVLLDGYDAATWRGDAGDADVELEEGGRALRCDAGGAGEAGVWAVRDGLVLLEYFPEESIDRPYRPAVKTALGLRVAQLPARGKVERLGTIEIKSGCLAVLPAYGDGSPIARRDVDAAAKGSKVKHLGDGDLGLVPLRAGRYDVFRERLKATEAGLGELDTRIRIVRAAPAASSARGTGPRPLPAAPATTARKVVWLKHAEEPGAYTLIDWKDAPEYDEDDFLQAVMALGRQKLGFAMQGRKRRMVIASVGRSRLTALWPIPGGVALVELAAARGADLGASAVHAALGEAIEKPPAASKAKALGRLSVRGGGLAIFQSEHRLTRTQVKPVASAALLRRGGKAVGFLVPLAGGTYAVTSDLLNAKSKLGTVARRVRIVKQA
jgi:hypothetical protein